MVRSVRQLSLDLVAPRRWGGRRARAGRKPKGDRVGLPHLRRPDFASRHPLHVTLRVRPGVPSLRKPRFVREFERRMTAGCERGSFRVVQYSLQSNHVHLVVEAESRSALARGMIAVGSRLARVVNRIFGRHGPVLDDRYHARVLRSPREVRNVLRYVLLNVRHHVSQLTSAALDSASSARWFDGWCDETGELRRAWTGPRPVARARTWLLAKGWRQHGLIDPGDVPGSG